MKRLMPSSLIAFLQSNRNFLKADLFSIFLPTGQTLNVTSGQWDITVLEGTPGWSGPTITFYATQFGRWSRGSITSEASYSLTSNSMPLTVVPTENVSYPGLSIGMLNGVVNGLFDAATLYVYTVYMPLGQYGTVYVESSDLNVTPNYGGVETKFFGTITKVTKVDRVHAEFECADPFYLLNMKIPTRLLQTNCAWSFGDANCNPPGGAAAYTVAITAGTGSNQWVVNPTVTTGKMATAGYFTQGVIKCLTGANAGLSQTVKQHNTSAPYLQMMNKWLLPVNPGDTFSIIAGCDKTYGTCNLKFSNIIHFSGFPFIPVPTTII